MADRFSEKAASDLTYWIDQKNSDQMIFKAIIVLGYRKISWFVSVSQINYLPHEEILRNFFMYIIT